MAKDRQKDLSFYEWRFNAWRTSATRDMLDATGRGIYRELLDQCYAQGEFPNDPAYICRVCACTLEQFEAAWKTISKHFLKGRNGTLRNKFADLERRKYAEYIEGQRQRRKVASDKSNEIKEKDKLAPSKPDPRTDLTRQGQGQGQGHDNNTTQSDAAVADVARQIPAAESGWSDFANQIRSRYPTAGVGLIDRIAEAAIAEYPSIAEWQLIAALNAATESAGNQRSAALYMQTIPEVVRSWKR